MQRKTSRETWWPGSAGAKSRAGAVARVLWRVGGGFGRGGVLCGGVRLSGKESAARGVAFADT